MGGIELPALFNHITASYIGKTAFNHIIASYIGKTALGITRSRKDERSKK